MMELASYEAYCFDLDGTIYIGDRLLPGVLTTLTELRRRGKRIMFLTNTTVQTRQACQSRLERLGVACGVEEFITAAYASGAYFSEHAPDASVLLLGEAAMAEELHRFHIKTTEDPAEATHVLVGLDRAFSYDKLHVGMKAVRSGARLVAANPDPCCPVIDDVIPDTGALLKALEAASQSPVHMVIGKPTPYMANKVLEQLGLPGSRCLMVGDRLETDILLGRNSGMRTALVLTGIAARADIEALHIAPDYILNTLGELVGAGERMNAERSG